MTRIPTTHAVLCTLTLTIAIVALADHASAQVFYRRPYAEGYRLNYGFDNNGGGGGCSDYDCGGACYDGHTGEDFGTPFGTTVLAAAAGTVISAHNGCANYGSVGNTCGGRCGNYVQLQHADGSRTIYCHMQLDSLRVGVGASVACGQPIGTSASSGSSSGPHLHFAFNASSGAPRAEVFQGPCGAPATRWVAQSTYRDPVSTECSRSCDRSGGPFTFSCDGTNGGEHCVSVDEPGDPDSWSDNYLCSAGDVGFRWSTAGPIDGMRCVNVAESAEDPAEAAAWADNYACVPSDAPFELLWSSAGPVDGWQCVHWNEAGDPGSWHDNFLCSRAVSRFSAGGFTFSGNGTVAGMHCVSVDEPGDPDTWVDNFFCSTDELGMVWSTAGPIDGMTCVAVHESADAQAAAWSDNYLCLPDDADYEFEWSSAGPIEGMTCVRWYEAADLAGTWNDNYLCVREVEREPDAGPLPLDGGGAIVLPDGAVLDGGASSRDASSSLDAGSDPGRDGRLSPGCGCRVGGGATPRAMILLALGALGAVASRRRRSSPRA